MQGDAQADAPAPQVARHLREASETELRAEVLRLRDLLIGAQLELGAALGRVTELEAQVAASGTLKQQLRATVRAAKNRALSRSPL